MTTDQEQRSYWKRCSSCKAEIGFSTVYWVCSVSTCNRKRTGMVFCSVGCWEMHLPMMRHREAYAVEKRSPTRQAWQREQSEASAGSSSAGSSSAGSSSAGSSSAGSSSSEAGSSSSSSSSGASPRRRVAVSAPAPARGGDDEVETDILVVVSKLKKYIRARSGMNTSDGVMPALSDHLRALCDAAIRTAAEDGRKTVLDRDLPPIRGES